MSNQASKKRKWTAEEVKQWYRDNSAVTYGNMYANPDDLNIVVRKPRSEGLTLNFANPKAYLLIGTVLAAVFTILHFVN